MSVSSIYKDKALTSSITLYGNLMNDVVKRSKPDQYYDLVEYAFIRAMLELLHDAAGILIDSFEKDDHEVARLAVPFLKSCGIGLHLLSYIKKNGQPEFPELIPHVFNAAVNEVVRITEKNGQVT